MKIYAYRGYASKYTENTLLAFEKAIEAGADGIQLDLQMTRDKQLVIFHDDSMSRLTNEMGFIRHHMLSDLENVRFRRESKGKEGKIPSFARYCQWASQFPLPTFIQLKNYDFDYAGMEEAVLKLLDQYDLTDQTVLTSRNQESLHRIHRLRPDLPTGLVLAREKDLDEIGEEDTIWEELGIRYLLADIRLIDSDLQEQAEAHGLVLIPYGLSSEEDFLLAQQLDVPACIAADVGKARKQLHRKDLPFSQHQILQNHKLLENQKKEKAFISFAQSSGFFPILISMVISVGAASLISYTLRNILKNFIPY